MSLNFEEKIQLFFHMSDSYYIADAPYQQIFQSVAWKRLTALITFRWMCSKGKIKWTCLAGKVVKPVSAILHFKS